MSSVVLDVLDVEDWRRWRAIRLAALGDAPGAFASRYDDWVSAPEDRYRERLASVPFNVVAVLDGEDVGMAAATRPDTSQVTELRSLWVAPRARGGDVSGALVGAVATWARTHGAGALSLGVRAANARAIVLYRRLGFVDVGPRAVESGPPERSMRLTLR